VHAEAPQNAANQLPAGEPHGVLIIGALAWGVQAELSAGS